MIRFRFGLRTLDDVQPWGEDPPRLSWFILTDGWYCIDADDHELLRYSAPLAASPFDVHVDYHVVRLWEDLLTVLPAALEPVPADLRRLVAAEPWEGWRPALSPGLPPDLRRAAEAAAAWHDEHTLDMGHLRDAPWLRFWRTADGDGNGNGNGEDTVTLSWQHPPDSDVEFVAPASGRVTVPTDAFIAAVTDFDHVLISAMDERVTELETGGPPPGVSVDLAQLRREHQDRASWLQRAFERSRSTDWEAVRVGARVLLAGGGR
ncbi:DUF5984 family protein [Streptomycetaceae bacterium NBC_01309]